MRANQQTRNSLEKPAALFHASRTADIELFEPRNEHVRDEHEGPRVFATPSRALASLFLVETEDDWTQSGMMDGTPYIIIADEPRFSFLDNGGAIYSLPVDTFECDPNKGLREFEWTSASKVKPISVEVIPSALEDMLSQGVRVYFVDKDTFTAIQHAADDGKSIVEQLTPYTK
jgi:hypothetical protein